MGIFDQMGDPVCPPCICEHHEEAYVDRGGQTPIAATPEYDVIDLGVTILQQAITTTETCCIVVNAAILTAATTGPPFFEIERPQGSIRTTQEDEAISGDLKILHHAAWETLPPGTYTYFLMNRIGAVPIHAAWLKVIASDCEG